jgi:hypothetical protein
VLVELVLLLVANIMIIKQHFLQSKSAVFNPYNQLTLYASALHAT